MFVEDLAERLDEKISSIQENDRTVLWGMGNYTENIFVHTNISKYRFDDYVDTGLYGRRKFGKTIKHPDEINWEMIDVVVISTLKWSDEIEKELIQKYHFSGRIIKLRAPCMTRPLSEYESCKDLVPSNEYAVSLEKNRIYENKYKNKKCYILGNGPSLHKNNLEKIQLEVKFVVNEFYRFDKALEVRPNHYIIADPLYFDLDSKFMRDFWGGVFNLSECNSEMKFWVPVYYQQFIDREFGKFNTRFHYYLPSRNLSYIEDNRIDFSEAVPATSSVVQYAILLAIYMGFTDIKLLGCEQTNVIPSLNNYLSDSVVDYYAYNMSETDAKAMNGLLRTYTLEHTLSGYGKIFKGYRELYEICAKRGITITNCVDETFVQGIPKGDFIQ